MRYTEQIKAAKNRVDQMRAARRMAMYLMFPGGPDPRPEKPEGISDVRWDAMVKSYVRNEL